jgi:hypothetical protein
MFCVGTVLNNALLMQRLKRQEDEEEDISRYWMTLRRREDIGS